MMQLKQIAIINNKSKTSSNTLLCRFIYSCLGISIAIANPRIAQAQNTVNFPTPQDFETQQMAMKAIQICSLAEMEAQNNPNNYQARSLFNNCMLLLQQKHICVSQKIMEIPANSSPNLTECDAELARFAEAWGNQ